MTDTTKETNHFSENKPDPGLADGQGSSYFEHKHPNAVRYKKIFKDCYFYINDISLSYREYYEAFKGRWNVSVVAFRNRLVDMILKRGGAIEAERTPYVTHFIVERAACRETWWIFRRIKGSPKQYQFITAKYVVECHLRGRRLDERQYFPRFLKYPQLLNPPKSRGNKETPRQDAEGREHQSPSQSSKVESFRLIETWPQLLEHEQLEEFQNMDCGIYMNGNIVYVYIENFLVDALVGRNVDHPAAVYNFGQVTAVNAHARKLGVKRGMGIERALELCNCLRLARYDYDKVTGRALELVRLFKRYTPHILSPYYNEFHLQIPYSVCREHLENPSGNWNENICRLALQIKKEVPMDCVIGIGKNMLLAKLASKKCRGLKVNSQESECDYELSPVLAVTGMAATNAVCSLVSEDTCIVNDGFKFLNNVYLTEIPGVGLLGPVLKSRGLVTCKDVRKAGSPLCLQSILGGRVGKMVYNFCFGYDYRCANLPKKQLDFFLNKFFTSKVTLGSQESDLSHSAGSREHTQDTYKGIDPPNPSTDQAQPSQHNKNGSQHSQTRTEKEEAVLRALLNRVLREVCSVYSLFDKCIINYSIKYRCTLALQVHTDFVCTKSMSSILDRESLRHTMHTLYHRIKKEFCIDFSTIKALQLSVRDIVRVDENLKFIDRFLTDRARTPQGQDTNPNTTPLQPRVKCEHSAGDSEESPAESMRTPTRRLNGWRLDCLERDETPGGRSRSSGSRSSTRMESRSANSRASRSESSVESHLRTPSRGRRARLGRGQTYITEYLSPTKLEGSTL